MPNSPEENAYAVTAILLRLERKVDNVLQRQSAQEEVLKAIPDHETRMRSLERFRYAFPSLAAIALLVGVVGVVIPHL